MVFSWNNNLAKCEPNSSRGRDILISQRADKAWVTSLCFWLGANWSCKNCLPLWPICWAQAAQPWLVPAGKARVPRYVFQPKPSRLPSLLLQKATRLYHLYAPTMLITPEQRYACSTLLTSLLSLCPTSVMKPQIKFASVLFWSSKQNKMKQNSNKNTLALYFIVQIWFLKGDSFL